VPTASAPGIRRIHNSVARKRSPPMRVAANISPMKMKSGTTTMMKLLEIENDSDAN
jgi:hypothetical protein